MFYNDTHFTEQKYQQLVTVGRSAGQAAGDAGIKVVRGPDLGYQIRILAFSASFIRRRPSRSTYPRDINYVAAGIYGITLGTTSTVHVSL